MVVSRMELILIFQVCLILFSTVYAHNSTPLDSYEAATDSIDQLVGHLGGHLDGGGISLADETPTTTVPLTVANSIEQANQTETVGQEATEASTSQVFLNANTDEQANLIDSTTVEPVIKLNYSHINPIAHTSDQSIPNDYTTRAEVTETTTILPTTLQNHKVSNSIEELTEQDNDNDNDNDDDNVVKLATILPNMNSSLIFNYSTTKSNPNYQTIEWITEFVTGKSINQGDQNAFKQDTTESSTLSQTSANIYNYTNDNSNNQDIEVDNSFSPLTDLTTTVPNNTPIKLITTSASNDFAVTNFSQEQTEKTTIQLTSPQITLDTSSANNSTNQGNDSHFITQEMTESTTFITKSPTKWNEITNESMTTIRENTANEHGDIIEATTTTLLPTTLQQSNQSSSHNSTEIETIGMTTVSPTSTEQTPSTSTSTEQTNTTYKDNKSESSITTNLPSTFTMLDHTITSIKSTDHQFYESSPTVDTTTLTPNTSTITDPIISLINKSTEKVSDKDIDVKTSETTAITSTTLQMTTIVTQIKTELENETQSKPSVTTVSPNSFTTFNYSKTESYTDQHFRNESTVSQENTETTPVIASTSPTVLNSSSTPYLTLPTDTQFANKISQTTSETTTASPTTTPKMMTTTIGIINSTDKRNENYTNIDINTTISSTINSSSTIDYTSPTTSTTDQEYTHLANHTSTPKPGNISSTLDSSNTTVSFLESNGPDNTLPTKNYTLTTKCFQDLGCITSDGFFDTLKTLPLTVSDPHDLNVTFNLFTRSNRYERQVFHYKSRDSLLRSSWIRPNRKTKFIIHGYLSKYEDNNWMAKMKDFLLRHADYNVIAVDWSNGSHSDNYFHSAVNTRVVGAIVAHFISRLENQTQTSINKMHCIGHSLGAHVCGFAGQRLNSPKLGQISALDPAGPGFLLNDPDTRLDPSDADLVTVLHTNAGIFRSDEPSDVTGIVGHSNHLGHFDFWPNGGVNQPGCGATDTISTLNAQADTLKSPRFKCNHARAQLYPLSPRYTRYPRSSCQFIGYKCASYAEFEAGGCADCGPDNERCLPMEFDFDYWDNVYNVNDPMIIARKTHPDKSNNFYLKTHDSEPYCLLHYQILVQISSNSSEKASGRLEVAILHNKNITINRSSIDRESGQDFSFESGRKYTALYVDITELRLSPLIAVRWTSQSRNTIKIDNISINFMSHMSERIISSIQFNNIIGFQFKPNQYCINNSGLDYQGPYHFLNSTQEIEKVLSECDHHNLQRPDSWFRDLSNGTFNRRVIWFALKSLKS